MVVVAAVVRRRVARLAGWRVGSATNATMTQVAAAWNGNAVIMILRECLHKCLLSGEAEGRRWADGLFSP